MGEVYRAHDSRLNRDVAIKVSMLSSPSGLPAKPCDCRAQSHEHLPSVRRGTELFWSWSSRRLRTLRGPLDLDDALPIIQQLIDGIEGRARKEHNHRDLKARQHQDHPPMVS